MKKSVYSLVLSDSVILAADKMAAKRGMSRSSYINEVLAKTLSCTTPEMRISDIFEHMISVFENQELRLQNKPSDAMLSLLGSVSYKYNPTVRYSVGLNRNTEGTIGTLKISFRTQSKGFTAALAEYFSFVSHLERSFAPKGAVFSVEPGRFLRTLVVPAGNLYSAGETSRAISDYIRLTDHALNAFFQHYPNLSLAQSAVTEAYQMYVNKANYLI